MCLAHLGVFRMQLIMKLSLQLIRIMLFMPVHPKAVLRAGLGTRCRWIPAGALSCLSLHTAATPKSLSFYPGLRFPFRAPALLSLLDTAIPLPVTEPRQPAEHTE